MRGIGRHILGSQIFDYWQDPWGDKHEHYCDGDLFTADEPTGVHAVSREAMAQWPDDAAQLHETPVHAVEPRGAVSQPAPQSRSDAEQAADVGEAVRLTPNRLFDSREIHPCHCLSCTSGITAAPNGVAAHGAVTPIPGDFDTTASFRGESG